MATRIPTSEADVVRELAEERDWSYSETLAELITIALRHSEELPAPTAPQELPLRTAS